MAPSKNFVFPAWLAVFTLGTFWSTLRLNSSASSDNKKTLTFLVFMTITGIALHGRRTSPGLHTLIAHF